MNESAPNRSGGGVRRKAMFAGGAAILALGFWLGSMFRGPGLGGGDADGSTDEDGVPATVGTEDVSADLGNVVVVQPAGANAADAARSAPDTLAILVTGDRYLLAKTPFEDATSLPPPLSQHFSPVELEAVVARAQAVAGSKSGIKVRVYQHKSSTVGSYTTLLQALKDAGLDDGAIHRVTGFFD